ncbi:molybdopterin-containing oxidoreductase family protein [Novosphingobium taihuense]|uniref:Anaerobic selenocysteine-containing dehydrogenase n=1 Tax=Novosphingobium taihuense TaxID=260085 RepID=A0A7W7EUS1_9SPHN|nr:molybdopterin-dependent oxidoreductase [Novosphingobium taihuense]MBB4614269.1 anaerobic selenocysteine-containing dehydrogenase [Novosphingobium taihuense]TWH87116.1 anaerobic selenocysteine-containing dehydrogenase [Novosphingobium taihuense]
MQEVKTFCRICNSACGLIADVDDGEVVKLRADRNHPLSGGYSCSKGRNLPAFHRSPRRLLAPKIRRNGEFTTTDWDEALDDLADNLRTIVEQSGVQAIGFFIGAGAFFDGLLYLTARGAAAKMGTPQAYSDQTIDSIPKSIACELVAGSPMALTQPDFERCRMLLYFGANPLVSHGQATAHSNPTKLLRDVAKRSEVWVVDPRKTETARNATHHLVVRPGSDHAILAYLVREILQDGADRAYISSHCQDVEQLAEAVSQFDLARASQATGLGEDSLKDLLAAVRRHGRVAIECGTGVSMSSTGGVVHWLSLALMAITGSLDQEGGVWFNPGFHTQADKRDIPSAPPEGYVRPGPASRPELSSWIGEYPVAAMPDEIAAGNLRALINLSGGLVQCMPDVARSKAALESLEVLATLDVVETETTQISTHVLPLKAQLERLDASMCLDMISPAVATSYTDVVIPPPPGVRSGWWVLAQIGKRLGYDLALGVDPDSTSDEEFMAYLTSDSPTSLPEMKEKGYVQATPAVFGWFLKRIGEVGGWRLAPAPLVEQLATISVHDAPLLMISRRLHLHFNSRSNGTKEAGGIIMNDEDAMEAGLSEGAKAIVRSAHGSVEGIVRIDKTLSRGVMNVPHGFADINANALTSLEHVNKLTGMPTYSALPVTVVPA